MIKKRISAWALDRLIERCCLLAVQVGPHQVGRHALEDLNQILAQLIGRIIGEPPGTEDPKVSFAVLMFTVGEGGWASWCSNSKRADMIKVLREMADNLELADELERRSE